MLENNNQQDKVPPTDTDIRNAHLENFEKSQTLSQLFRRANLMEIGLTGHVTQIELDIAKKDGLEPLDQFEKWLLEPWIMEDSN
jgi:hypothetical protein